VKTTLKPGEHILYDKHAAREVKDDEEELVLVREADVLGILA
jgi:co-chaperonin GroES (HSP10)